MTNTYSTAAKLKLIEQFRNDKKFVVDQPFTPVKLISEITANISAPKTAKVAVLFTVEWAIYLQEIGFTDVTVLTQDQDDVVQKACALFGFSYILLGQVKDQKMKFDVVVGNPPYTNGEQDASEIYTSIIDGCLDVTAPSVVAFITPENFINGGQKKKQLREKIFAKTPLNTLRFLNQRNDWNGNIKVDTVAWVAQAKFAGPVTVTSRHSNIAYNTVALSEYIDGYSQSVHDWILRIQTTNKVKLISAKKTGNRGLQIKITKDGQDNCTIEQGNEYDSHNNQWRVAFGYLRCNTCAVVPPGVSIPSKYRYKAFADEHDARKFSAYMLSEPIRFIMKLCYTSRSLDNPQLVYVPMLNLTNFSQVNDSVLYAYWNTPTPVQVAIGNAIKDEIPF